jgi:hypothetical protein
MAFLTLIGLAPSIADTSFWLGLLMAATHPFLGRTAELDDPDAARACPADGEPTTVRPSDLRR